MKIFDLCTHNIITKWTHIYDKSQWRPSDDDDECRDDSEHDEDDGEKYDDMPNGLPIVQKANNGIEIPFRKYWYHGRRRLLATPLITLSIHE